MKRLMTLVLIAGVVGSGCGSGLSASQTVNKLCKPHEGVLHWKNEGAGYVTATCKDGTAVDGDWG